MVWVVFLGSAQEAKLYGPFDSQHEAIEWGHHWNGGLAWIAFPVHDREDQEMVLLDEALPPDSGADPGDSEGME